MGGVMRRLRSLRVHLMSVILLAAIPLFALIAFNARMRREGALATAQQTTTDWRLDARELQSR